MAGKSVTKKPRKQQGSSTGKGRTALVKADQTHWRKKLQHGRIKFDDEQKQIYLAEIAKHDLKWRAAEACGVCLLTVKNHISNDPEFAAAVDEARVAYRDKFVDHATTLAYDGIPTKRFNREGKLIEERRDYPIRLIELELKRVEPGYRDKQTIDLNHAGGIMVAPAKLTPEDWVKQQEEKNLTRQPPEGSEDDA